MKIVLAMLLATLWLATAVPASAKVCYHCKQKKPVAFVCAPKDTFKARANARKLGCDWSAYSSSCNCGKWVKAKSAAPAPPSLRDLFAPRPPLPWRR